MQNNIRAFSSRFYAFLFVAAVAFLTTCKPRSFNQANSSSKSNSDQQEGTFKPYNMQEIAQGLYENRSSFLAMGVFLNTVQKNEVLEIAKSEDKIKATLRDNYQDKVKVIANLYLLAFRYTNKDCLNRSKSNDSAMQPLLRAQDSALSPTAKNLDFEKVAQEIYELQRNFVAQENIIRACVIEKGLDKESREYLGQIEKLRQQLQDNPHYLPNPEMLRIYERFALAAKDLLESNGPLNNEKVKIFASSHACLEKYWKIEESAHLTKTREQLFLDNQTCDGTAKLFSSTDAPRFEHYFLYFTRPMDILDINALHPFPVFILGYLEESYQYVDGGLMDTQSFLKHDYLHSLAQDLGSSHRQFFSINTQLTREKRNLELKKIIEYRYNFKNNLIARTLAKLKERNLYISAGKIEDVFFIVTHEAALVTALSEYRGLVTGTRNDSWGPVSTNMTLMFDNPTREFKNICNDISNQWNYLDFNSLNKFAELSLKMLVVTEFSLGFAKRFLWSNEIEKEQTEAIRQDLILASRAMLDALKAMPN